MTLPLWPLLVAVVGLLVYILASHAKTTELGRIAFFVGLFWTVYTLAGKLIHIG